MPVHNEAGLLRRALRSLQRQSLADWECLVSDDGSTDGSADVARSLRDPRIRVVQGPREGLVAALNCGLAHCRAPVIARMDADDVSHPHRLAAQIELLPGVDVASCRVVLFPRRPLRKGMLRYERWLDTLTAHDDIVRDMFVECPIPHPTIMLRRDLLHDVGGYQERGWPEDYDLLLRLHARGARFAKVERPLYFWCDRPDRTSRGGGSFSPRAFARCKLHYLRPVCGDTVALRGAGPTGKQLLRVLLDEGFTVPVLVDLDKNRVGQRVHGIPVVAPDDPSWLPYPLLIAVGVDGARAEIRAEMSRRGRVEGRDHWFLA